MKRKNVTSDCYVYEHWRPDKNVCFYVGKGRDSRGLDFIKGRNQYHQAIIGKLYRLGLQVEVRIAGKDLSDADALKLEMERIAFYGADNLSNLTFGGEGNEFSKPEVHERISKTHKQRWLDSEFKAWMLEALRLGQQNNPDSEIVRRQKISAAHKGRIVSDAWRESMRVAAKIRGISPVTRAAQLAAVTGKKRAPFTPETIAKMKVAASIAWAYHERDRPMSPLILILLIIILFGGFGGPYLGAYPYSYGFGGAGVIVVILVVLLLLGRL